MAGPLEHGRNKYIEACLGSVEGVRVYGNVILALPGPVPMVAGPCDMNGNYSRIDIGAGCDIAAFVTISCADSHMKCLGLAGEIERKPIRIGESVFIGQGATILGGCDIGHHSVIGAGVVLKAATIPPWSGVTVPPAAIAPGFYFREPDVPGFSARCHACGHNWAGVDGKAIAESMTLHAMKGGGCTARQR